MVLLLRYNKILLVLIISQVCWFWMSLGKLASYKIWIQRKTDNLQNWNTRLRIGGVNFPTNMESPVAFESANDDFCEIVFPLDDLIEDDIQPTAAQPKCPDSDNWKVSVTSLMSPAVPHIERLPCQYEEVYFLNSDDLFVILPNKNITVNNISYKNKSILQKLWWHSFPSVRLRSWDDIRQHLVVTGEADISKLITLTGRACTDDTGCVCGTWDLYREICAIVQNKCRTDFSCSSPIQPAGHCCKICGFYMEVFFDQQKFIYNKFLAVVTSWLKSTVLNIQFHISKKDKETVHIIIMGDDKNGKDVQNLVMDLKNKIETNDLLAVYNVVLTMPGTIYDGNTGLRPVWYVLLTTLLIIAGFLIYRTKTTKYLEAIYRNSRLVLVMFENNTQNVYLNKKSTNNDGKISKNSNSDTVKLNQENGETVNLDSEVFTNSLNPPQQRHEVNENLLDISE